MKKLVLITMAVAMVSLNARAQVELDLSGLIATAEEWATEHLDTNVVAALPQFDRRQAELLLQQVQARMESRDLGEMASLRETVTTWLPLLEAYEETYPYAVWLRARLDYFKVAADLQTTNRASGTSSNLVQASPDLAARQREIWLRELSAPPPWPPAASNLVPRLKPIFLAAGVPPELVWVAEVESSFNARARSPVGAAGLFQLMPETAKELGLSLWPWDQRQQPDRSARAAARYLKSLHRQFGDWRLALAAYNCGPGRVRRTLNDTGAKSFAAIAPELPAETQLFVPKLEAVLLRREGRRLEDLKLPLP